MSATFLRTPAEILNDPEVQASQARECARLGIGSSFTDYHPITRAARKRINAFARNGMGQDRYGNTHETVFVYSDEACRDFVCWYVGHAENGDVYTVDHHGADYVLRVEAGQ